MEYMSNLITAENLSFTYPASGERLALPVFDNLSLEIDEGSFTAIIGPNGCGKSTLAKHFNAVLLPTGGKVYVAGMDTADEEQLLEIRRQIGMVFQNPDNQIVANVVEEDVAFAPENLGVPSSEIRQRVDHALKTVGMYDYREHAPHLLSGGQKQRVAIAGVLAMRPRCIVLDEPTAMLDPRGREEVISTVTRLNREQGITVVLITHHMRETVGADRVIVMHKGGVLTDGSPREVFSQVELLRKAGLDVPQTTDLLYSLRAAGWDLPLSALTPEECAEAIKSTSSASAGDGSLCLEKRQENQSVKRAEDRPLRSDSPILEIKDLTHTYSSGTPFEHTAVENINLSFYPGELTGIIGHTGSGKSTLIQHLNGLLKPSAGTVLFQGEDIWKDKKFTHSIRGRVGLVFQYPEYQLFEETCWKDIAFGPKNQGISGDELDARVRRAACFVGIGEELLDKSPFDLSGGQKRRVAIAGVIAMEPDVLILDEPTAGLDAAGRDAILENIKAYQKAQNAAVIMVSHSMEEVAGLCGRLIVMNKSHVAMDGTPAEVFTHVEELTAMGLSVPQVTSVFALLRAKGLDLPADVYTVRYAVARLQEWKEGRSC